MVDASGSQEVAAPAQEMPAPEGGTELIETKFETGQDNIAGSVGRFPFDVHNPVFVISGLSIVVFVLYALIFREQATAAFEALRPWLTSTFDWFFLSAANIFVLFCLFLIVSPWGRIRLGVKMPSQTIPMLVGLRCFLPPVWVLD